MKIEQLVSYLQQNDIIAYPTEAVFGLGCNPYSEVAVQKLLTLKQRPKEKGLILIAPTLELLLPFIDQSALSEKHWQKLTALSSQPTTWVVPSNSDTPCWLTGQFDSIAIRLCRHPAVVELCRHTHFALTSTSANLSGLPPCKTAEEVRLQFGLNFPVYNQPVGQAQNPSQIRDIFTDQIIRNG
ncbi:Sua5/YciO/YrdC/YwlC family protein [Volucribacter amazonae]|uniref:Threonylcarbamoyl-AMP synthase n=1 Tax=Volucribacter amazonae TaxID=256731 RepID=A0A9X4PNU0_9PAST|nr:Sua5/YciO/YrdC/YwlC family protein [Volucribacter amazonae]MDG6895178.1 tRNA threonylcarbamoyladenosine biosynthesis protein RimN [Volucribacter amazonae]